MSIPDKIKLNRPEKHFVVMINTSTDLAKVGMIAMTDGTYLGFIPASKWKPGLKDDMRFIGLVAIKDVPPGEKGYIQTYGPFEP